MQSLRRCAIRLCAHTVFLVPRLRQSIVLATVCVLATASTTASAAQLPLVTGVSFDGQLLTWNAQNDATGYNVYRDFQYLGTVIEGTSFSPDLPGLYQVTAFDENGNFSPLRIDGIPIDAALVDTVSAMVSPPQNVSGITFSNSAGEIYWDRDPSSNLTYVVSLNNRQLGTTQGNSFWVDSLSPNASNVVSVLAMASSGVNSLPSSIVFDTTLPTFPVPATQADTVDNNPSTGGEVVSPQNASIEVYSATAAELFWDKAQAEDAIEFVEVLRDGAVLGTTPGNSFFDDSRSSQFTHSYELIAVNTAGQRSTPVVVNSDTFFNAFEDFFRPVLEGIDDVVGVAPIQFGFTGIESILANETPRGMVELSTETSELDGQLITRTDYMCSSGTLGVTSTGIPVGMTTFQFADCFFNGRTFGGAVIVSIFGDTGSFFDLDILDAFPGDIDYTSNFEYQDFSIVSDEDIVLLNGNVFSANTLTTELTECEVSYNDFNYVITSLSDDAVEAGTSGVTEVSLNQSTAFSSSDEATDPSTFTTRFSVFAPWTQGFTVVVDTTDTFAGEFDANDRFTSPAYSRGTLFAESGNGDNMTLSADTGDIQTWFAEATTARGTASANENWGQLIRLPFFEEVDCTF